MHYEHEAGGLVPTEGKVLPLARAEGFDKDGMKAVGYIVTLNCRKIRPYPQGGAFCR